MGTNVFIRNSLVAALGVAGLTLSACASSGSASDRYGSVYDYESGGECVDTRYGGCEAPVMQPAPVYPVATAPSTGVVYADCSQIGHMDCGMAPAPAPAPMPTPAHTEPTYTSSTYSTLPIGPVLCPAGTTDNGDGTCMENSSYGGSSTYSETTSGYSGSTYSGSTYSGSTYSSGEMADCPVNTTAQPDGTCMQGSSYSTGTTGYSSGSSYTSSTTTSSGPVICPAGTIMQPDGTCMESGYSTSTTYTTTDYLPIRK